MSKPFGGKDDGGADVYVPDNKIRVSNPKTGNIEGSGAEFSSRIKSSMDVERKSYLPKADMSPQHDKFNPGTPPPAISYDEKGNYESGKKIKRKLREMAEPSKLRQIFPKGTKAPVEKKTKSKIGDKGLMGYSLNQNDPETLKFIKDKHPITDHGDREDTGAFNVATDYCLDKPINKHLKGHGKAKERDVYEDDQLDEKNWIAGAIKHPGAEKKAAKKAGMSTHGYMEKHKHDSGKSGDRARLGLTLSKMHHEEVEMCSKCHKDPCQCDKSQNEPAYKKDKKLLVDKKVKEETMANLLAMEILEQRKIERLSEADIYKDPKDVPTITPKPLMTNEPRQPAPGFNPFWLKSSPPAGITQRGKTQQGGQTEGGKAIGKSVQKIDMGKPKFATKMKEDVKLCNKQDTHDTEFTKGMEVHKSAEGENQTTHKPDGPASNKSKKYDKRNIKGVKDPVNVSFKEGSQAEPVTNRLIELAVKAIKEADLYNPTTKTGNSPAGGKVPSSGGIGSGLKSGPDSYKDPVGGKVPVKNMSTGNSIRLSPSRDLGMGPSGKTDNPNKYPPSFDPDEHSGESGKKDKKIKEDIGAAAGTGSPSDRTQNVKADTTFALEGGKTKRSPGTERLMGVGSNDKVTRSIGTHRRIQHNTEKRDQRQISFGQSDE